MEYSIYTWHEPSSLFTLLVSVRVSHAGGCVTLSITREFQMFFEVGSCLEGGEIVVVVRLENF